MKRCPHGRTRTCLDCERTVADDLRAQLAAEKALTRDAYDVIRMLTTIDVGERRVELRDPEDQEFGDMIGDFFEIVRKAHAAGNGEE